MCLLAGTHSPKKHGPLACVFKGPVHLLHSVVKLSEPPLGEFLYIDFLLIRIYN